MMIIFTIARVNVGDLAYAGKWITLNMHNFRYYLNALCVVNSISNTGHILQNHNRYLSI